MTISTGGRPSLTGLTPDQLRDRRLRQAKEAKQRRKALIAQLRADGVQLCKHPLCIATADRDGFCNHHLGEHTHRKEVICIKCGKIAIPGAKLCGYCQELAEEQTQQTRRDNLNKRRALVRQAVHEVQREREAS